MTRNAYNNMAWHHDPMVRDIYRDVDWGGRLDAIAESVRDTYLDYSRSFEDAQDTQHLTEEEEAHAMLLAGRIVDWADYGEAYGDYSNPPWEEFVKAKTKNPQQELLAMTRLGKKDKQVIKAFVEQNGMLGHKLYSNGKRLDGLWMGGQGLAVWRNGKIDLPDSGSRSGQLVQNAVRRAAAKNDIRGKTKIKNPHYEEFTVSELEAMPTLSSGHMHDLKHDDGRRRYWLSRMTLEDGEQYAIYVEELQDGRWVDVHQYGEPSGYDDRFGNPKPDVRQLKNKLMR